MPIVLTPTATTAEVLEIDPVSEDANNANLLLEDSGTGYQIDIAGVDYGQPDRKPQTAGTADTVGDPLVDSGYGNRVITVPIRCTSPTAAGLDALVGAIQEKVGKLQREQGTLKRTTTGGNVLVFDVLDCDVDVPSDWQYHHNFTTIVTLKFTCLPPGWGDEVQVGTLSSLGGGVYHAVCPNIPGDFDARGRVLFTEGSAIDQWHAHWGVRSRYYGTATTEALYYEAETCLPQGGAIAAALSGASGGSAIYQGTLTTSYQSILSLASSGTVYKQHVGDYNLWARLHRPTSNTGEVSVALEWAEGDFTRFTRNVEVTYDANEREGDFTVAKLGQVHLSKAKKGSQRWDGHIVAKSSTLGDDLSVDGWWLQPVGDSAGEANGVLQLQTPTSFVVRDDFAQSAGTITGKTLPIGGTWAGAGDADDFSVSGSPLFVASRDISVADAALTSGHFAIAGSTAYTNIETQAGGAFLSATPGDGIVFGVFVRYVDTSNWVALLLNKSAADTYAIELWKYKAAALSTLLTVPVTPNASLIGAVFRLFADAGGHWRAA